MGKNTCFLKINIIFYNVVIIFIFSLVDPDRGPCRTPLSLHFTNLSFYSNVHCNNFQWQ